MPCSSPNSKTVTMFRWLRAATDCASRWKRLRNSSSAVRVAATVLMATKRFNTRSWALYTSPMAPSPILSRILYFPSCSNSIASKAAGAAEALRRREICQRSYHTGTLSPREGALSASALGPLEADPGPHELPGRGGVPLAPERRLALPEERGPLLEAVDPAGLGLVRGLAGSRRLALRFLGTRAEHRIEPSRQLAGRGVVGSQLQELPVGARGVGVVDGGPRVARCLVDRVPRLAGLGQDLLRARVLGVQPEGFLGLPSGVLVVAGFQPPPRQLDLGLHHGAGQLVELPVGGAGGRGGRGRGPPARQEDRSRRGRRQQDTADHEREGSRAGQEAAGPGAGGASDGRREGTAGAPAPSVAGTSSSGMVSSPRPAAITSRTSWTAFRNSLASGKRAAGSRARDRSRSCSTTGGKSGTSSRGGRGRACRTM